MDPNAYSITFPVFIGLLLAGIGSGVWIFIQRQLKKSDEASREATSKVDERFRDQGGRIGALSDQATRLELALANKVGREELDKLYDKIDDLKREWKEDARDLKMEILAAINGHKGS